MMVGAINLIVLALGIFIVGMIKPRWLLFWMDKPTRLHINFIAFALFMSGAFMFGEATQEKQSSQTKQVQQTSHADTAPVVDENKKTVTQ